MTKRLRVMFSIGSLDGGGSERQLVLLLRHLDRSRFEPMLYLVYKSGALLNEVPNDVPVHSFDTRVTSSRMYLPGLMHARRVSDYARCLTQNHVDVSYDRTFLMTLIAAAGARKANVPNVSTVVTNPELGFAPVAGRFQWFKRRLLHTLYNQSTQVLAVSAGAREAAIRFYGINPERIAVHRNGVDINHIQQQSRDTVVNEWWNAAAHNGRRVVRIVSAGRLNREKGFHLLIEAIAQLQESRNDVEYRLAILGQGPSQCELDELIARKGLQQSIRLVGFQTNAPAWYRSADAFVLASLMEGMPNVLLEAMACGTPVISTDCPSGPGEILGAGRCGQLIPAGNSQAIATAIHELRNEAATAARTQAATAEIQSNWSIQSAANRLAEFLELAARQSKGPA